MIKTNWQNDQRKDTQSQRKLTQIMCEPNTKKRTASITGNNHEQNNIPCKKRRETSQPNWIEFFMASRGKFQLSTSSSPQCPNLPLSNRCKEKEPHVKCCREKEIVRQRDMHVSTAWRRQTAPLVALLEPHNNWRRRRSRRPLRRRERSLEQREVVHITGC
jgi:hypothetical protein